MTTQIEIIPAPQMSVRIVEASPSYLGFALQYEYARAGRPKLYGGVQEQVWRTICWDGYAGREGAKHYETLAAARAAARRVIARNNTKGV